MISQTAEEYSGSKLFELMYITLKEAVKVQ